RADFVALDLRVLLRAGIGIEALVLEEHAVAFGACARDLSGVARLDLRLAAHRIAGLGSRSRRAGRSRITLRRERAVDERGELLATWRGRVGARTEALTELLAFILTRSPREHVGATLEVLTANVGGIVLHAEIGAAFLGGLPQCPAAAAARR